MTCIVGIAHKGSVFIGGDSCGSDGYTWSDVHKDKVFAVGPILFGICGSFRLRDLLQYSLAIPDHDPRASVDEYIKTVFMTNLMQTFANQKFAVIKDEVLSMGGSSFLMGYQGHLYEIQNDFSAIACPEWGQGIGSGGDIARGALYVLKTEKDPKKKVLRALEASGSIVTTVKGPYYVKSI